ncbi:MAG: hypothetical protein V2A62_00265 [Candidatus Woesearchaeota archaeon]
MISSYEDYHKALREVEDLEEMVEGLARIYFSSSNRGEQINVYDTFSQTKALLSNRKLEIESWEEERRKNSIFTKNNVGVYLILAGIAAEMIGLCYFACNNHP